MSPLNLARTRPRVTGAGRAAQAGASCIAPFCPRAPANSDIWHQCERASLRNCFCRCTCLLPFLRCDQSPRLLTAVRSPKAQKKASPWGPFVSMPRCPSGCLSINGAFWDPPRPCPPGLFFHFTPSPSSLEPDVWTTDCFIIRLP